MAARWHRVGLPVAALALAAACARGPVVGPPSTVPVPPPAAAGHTLPEGDAGLIVEAARRLVGAPYRDGGASPEGFDCSGLVQYVFASRGIALPRSVSEQARAGIAVPRHAIAAGDLVFFTTIGASLSHVGIALDTETFVHAPSTGGSVRIERLSVPYWASRLAAARRVVVPSS